MEILIIGNGFDLAHKLPTSYVDFLDYFENLDDKSFKTLYFNYK